MSFSVSILATGSELLDGRVVDTNSNFVAQELAERGLKLRRVLVVDDDMNELLYGLKELSAVSDIVITSGGLGPTSDDLTRDFIAQFFGVSLAEHPQGRRHLEDFFAKRNRALDATNLRQAMLPVGAEYVHNENGTAPGFLMRFQDGRIVVSLSGVPREFKAMFRATVLPLIEGQKGTARIQRRTMKIFGLPESTVGRLIESLKLPRTITVSYRAAFPEVHVVLKASEDIDLAPSVAAVKAVLGQDTIFTEDPQESFIGSIHKLLETQKATVATAESCTGGMVSEILTRTPGSSATFTGGVVAYSNSIKSDIVGVSKETLQAHGAVSAETVQELASGVRKLCKTSYGISISGIAGPDGGTTEKPVGTFFVGVAAEGFVRSMKCVYPSDRHNVRSYASYVSLDLLRRSLQGESFPESYPIQK
jgi:nicotinamide-nucleotide amidase